MSTREIVGHVQELYGIDVSPDLISAVTDAVLDEVTTWQSRPLEPVYPLVFFDALRVEIRDEGHVRDKAVHIALGVRGDGTKEILGVWIETNEGAKFWLRVEKKWKMPPREWAIAKSQFTISLCGRPQGRKRKCSTARLYTKSLTVPDP
ncbi:transposase for insertion sequence element isrm3 [Rhizobium sp. CCGE 510]|nr:transposase for insertion sequence element isrm3 [Rhizobium sp. CCGE 510]